MKTDDYETVYRLNRYFDALVASVDRLQSSNLLSPEASDARKTALEEIRARTNFAVAQGLESRESQDLCRFEDLRIAAARKESDKSELR